MNPHQAPPASIKELFASFWRNRKLILQMNKREVVGRDHGSVMGLVGSFFNPILMLTVYTFVFSVVFKARWGVGGDERILHQFGRAFRSIPSYGWSSAWAY